MIDKKVFKKTIAAPLKRVGCTQKGQTWYLDGKNVIIAINLQKSDWSELYYVNIGFWLKGLGEATFPKFYDCHLYYRIEAFFPENRDLIFASCSLEESTPEKLDELSRFMEYELIPFLKECTDEQKLRELMALGKLNNGLVRKEARQYLSTKQE